MSQTPAESMKPGKAMPAGVWGEARRILLLRRACGAIRPRGADRRKPAKDALTFVVCAIHTLICGAIRRSRDLR